MTARSEHRAAVRRTINEVTGFLYGWNAAVYLRVDPNRAEVLAALSESDRDRFLAIEECLPEPSRWQQSEREGWRSFMLGLVEVGGRRG